MTKELYEWVVFLRSTLRLKAAILFFFFSYDQIYHWELISLRDKGKISYLPKRVMGLGF